MDIAGNRSGEEHIASSDGVDTAVEFDCYPFNSMTRVFGRLSRFDSYNKEAEYGTRLPWCEAKNEMETLEA